MDTEYGGVAEGEVGPVARKLSSFPPGVGFWRLERGLPRCPQPCPLAGQVEAEEGGGRQGAEGEEGSGKGSFARLVSVESKPEEEEEEEGSGIADYLDDDPLQGNLSKRAINLSELAAGGHQQRKMLGLQSLGELKL